MRGCLSEEGDGEGWVFDGIFAFWLLMLLALVLLSCMW